MSSLNSMKDMLLYMLSGHPGEKVRNAIVYLETESGGLPVAFQKTGKAGKVTFAYLDKDVYKLVMSLPQQKGKLTRETEGEPTDLQVAYHTHKRIYFFQGREGYFTLRFTGIKNLSDSNITPMLERDPKLNDRVITGKFEVDGNYGSVTLKISALSHKSYRKLIDKYRHDSEMAVIVGKNLVER